VNIIYRVELLAKQIIDGEDVEFPLYNDFLIAFNKRLLFLMSQRSMGAGIGDPILTSKNIDNYIIKFVNKLTIDYKLIFAKDLITVFNSLKHDELIDNSEEFVKLLRQHSEVIRGY